MVMPRERTGRVLAPQQRGAPTFLAVDGLCVEFPTPHGPIRALDDVSFTINPGETVGLVGESGSGKTITGLSVLRLLPPDAQLTGGRVLVDNTDILQLPTRRLREIRGRKIAMVFQDTMASLHPLMTLGAQIAECLREHQGMNRAQAREEGLRLLDSLAIPDPHRRWLQYPHQLSGGMRQRGMLAMALACNPKLLIADEPTTALDATTQAQLLSLLRNVQQERGLGVLLISHDLMVVSKVCQRVLVMYGGMVVEEGPVTELFANPAHPYTQTLVQSLSLRRRPSRPHGAQSQTTRRQPSDLSARVLSHDRVEPGCRFQHRCAWRAPGCVSVRPSWVELAHGHRVRCILPTAETHPPAATADRRTTE